MQCLTWIASTVLASFMTRDSCFCIRIQNSFRLFWKSSTRVLCLSGRFWVSWRSFRQWLACRPPLPALCTKWLQDKCRPERASWYVDHMRIFCVDIYTKHFRLVSLMYFTSRQDPSVSTLCLIVMIIAYRMSPSPSTIGNRAFSVAASKPWKTLPQNVTSAPSRTVFRKVMKTHLFNRSIPKSPVVPAQWLHHSGHYKCVIIFYCSFIFSLFLLLHVSQQESNALHVSEAAFSRIVPESQSTTNISKQWKHTLEEILHASHISHCIFDVLAPKYENSRKQYFPNFQLLCIIVFSYA